MSLSLLKYSDRVFFKVSIVFFNFRVGFLSVDVLQTQTHFPQGLINFNQSNHTCSLRKHGYGLIYCGLCYLLVPFSAILPPGGVEDFINQTM